MKKDTFEYSPLFGLLFTILLVVLFHFITLTADNIPLCLAFCACSQAYSIRYKGARG